MRHKSRLIKCLLKEGYFPDSTNRIPTHARLYRTIKFWQAMMQLSNGTATLLCIAVHFLCTCTPQPPSSQQTAVTEVAEQPVDPVLQDRCQSAIHHITTLIAGFGGAPPSEQEAAIIKVTEQMSVSKCVHEGLSEAQARCVLDTPDALGIEKLRECPAIRDKQPSWLLLPPPGASDRPLGGRPGDPAGAAEERDEAPGTSASQPQ